MNKVNFFLKKILFVTILILASSCNEQKKLPDQSEKLQIKYDSGDVTSNGLLDKEGNMWFATLTEGVFKFDGISFTNFTMKDGLCSNKVNSVIEDNKGNLWFATAKGLCRYDGEVFTNFPLPQEHIPSVSPETGLPSRKTEEVLSLIQDKKGDFWLGTISSGAYRFDGKTFTSFLRYKGRVHPEDKVYNNCIQSIVEDDIGDIWFTSQTHGGISRYDGNTFTHFTKEDGLSDDMIFSSFKDSDGNLWFGTLDSGLISYKEGSFRFFKDKEWQNISCFYQDNAGKLWIGSFREEPVLWFDGEKFISVPFDKEKKLVEIRFITEDKDGNVWFGGRYGILYRYDGKELKDFTQQKRL